MFFIIIIILIMLSAFFSASETALSSVNKIRLMANAEEGDRNAKRALNILESYDRVLTTILIGNNIVNLTAASIGTIAFTRLIGDRGVLVSTIVITIVVLTFSEIIPKSIAKENAEMFSLAFAAPLSILMKILSPITYLFILLKNNVASLFGSEQKAPTVTEEELFYIIDEIEDEGVLEEQESNLVKSALEFDEITVGEILVPRVDVVAIEAGESAEKIKETFIKEKYSRLPVYDKTIDNIIGVINEKDFFKFLIANEGENVQDIVKKITYVHSLQKISEVLLEMQRRKLHIAVVTDQYGGTEGIVTLEDILEELVGEIWDENDEIHNPILEVGENRYEVSAELNLHDMLEELGLPIDTVESTHKSVGGWVLELLGRIPNVGDVAKAGIFEIMVKETSEQRIVKLLIKVNSDKTSGEEDD